MNWDSGSIRRDKLEGEERKIAINISQKEKSEVSSGKKKEGWL